MIINYCQQHPTKQQVWDAKFCSECGSRLVPKELKETGILRKAYGKFQFSSTETENEAIMKIQVNHDWYRHTEVFVVTGYSRNDNFEAETCKEVKNGIAGDNMGKKTFQLTCLE